MTFKKKSKIVSDIDEDNIKEEWSKQASSYEEYARKAVKALKKSRKAKAKLDFIFAKIDFEIREENKKNKPNEAAIKQAVVLDKRYQKALQEQIEAEYKHKLYSEILNTLEHKKSGLEFFGRVYLSTIYAEPKETDKNIRNTLNKRKRR